MNLVYDLNKRLSSVSLDLCLLYKVYSDKNREKFHAD